MTPEISKLHPVSIGIVAANKKLTEKHIEVVPFEEYSMLDGEITDHESEYKGNGENEDGESFNLTLKTTPSIRALWLPMSDTNRKTAPDVRRGERVYIYRFGDSDEYFWTTCTHHETIRRLETVIYAWSNNREENVENDSESTYFLEISTHTKKVRFHTSDNDGEHCKYDFQFDTKAGNVTLEDDKGNYFFLDTAATQIKLRNKDDSYVDINKKIITLHSLDKIINNTQHFEINAEQTITNKTKKYVEKTDTYDMHARISHKTLTKDMWTTVENDWKVKVEHDWLAEVENNMDVKVKEDFKLKSKHYKGENETRFEKTQRSWQTQIVLPAPEGYWKFIGQGYVTGSLEISNLIKALVYKGGHHV